MIVVFKIFFFLVWNFHLYLTTTELCYARTQRGFLSQPNFIHAEKSNIKFKHVMFVFSAWIKEMCYLNNHLHDNLWVNHKFTNKCIYWHKKQSNRKRMLSQIDCTNIISLVKKFHFLAWCLVILLPFMNFVPIQWKICYIKITHF